ncbi:MULTISPECIES: alkaline phosphatase family protein [unclassified Aliiroseovarius]|uniref:alkaline phosphatase family protein n=1 Tax=unclassified Aliiroseovarius TaxID=2623558 RepID=UPI001569520E|nr:MULTISPECIES: alkaline phosphatase family protein [unclassified Aliiroseovarius]NRP14290.1 Arylsulfatase [Aliiroseovarius sp. xm-d-517]NRP42434.1 Arylsulfatase [Aliiroseovarius sp. xm-m-339-2]NRP63374.1 Arylsulfatase [Aliiroseovarius sp. xm-a-151]
MTAQTPPRKNVLFIIIDQLRADCVSGAMADHVDLPNLRNLMRDAVSFERHFSVVNPCGPSRASILTGQYSMNHRSVRNGTPLRHDTPNVATEMRKAGYLPMLFGYTDTSGDPRIHHPNDPAVQSYEYPMAGFHEMLEMRLEQSLPWQSYLIRNGYQFDDYWDLYKPVSPSGNPPKLNDPALYKAEHSDTAFLTGRFLETMDAYAKQGWFAHLTYIRPHPPLVAPAPYNDMYDPAGLPLPNRLDSAEMDAALHPYFTPAQKSSTAADFVKGFPDLSPTDEAIQTLRAVYLGLATEVDHHIGRVVQFLKDSGQYDDTLLIVTADHGEMLGDHHLWGKMTVHDAAYHTPLIIRLPGNDPRAGERVSQPTESIDLMPTILDWVGQEVPNSVDGRSLLPLTQGEIPSDWRRYSFSELDFADPENPTRWEQELGTDPSTSNLSILRDNHLTLIEFADETLDPILFDHRANGETENLAQNPSYATDLARMSRQMLRHRMRNMDHTLSMDMITHSGPRHFSRRR